MKLKFNSENRNFGLDIARCIAISLVLLAHSGIHFLFGINLGFLGVEIFFVLSGFLIGQIILREFKDSVNIENCGTFYINRWLRTFPLYYLVLIIKDVASGTGFHFKHYFFIQNNADLNFFPVSWSLAIEEWFYILIPIVFLINTRTIKINAITFISVLMIVSILSRLFYIQITNPEIDLGVRKFIPLRFDALLTGVLFSIIKVNYTSFYERISNYRSLILSALLFIVSYFIYKKYILLESQVEAGITKSIFQSIVFVFFSFSFGFLLIWLETCSLNMISKKNIFLKLITTISILTYAIYLIHFDIFKSWIVSPVYTLSWLKEVLISTSILLPLAIGMHFLIEKPIMDIRKSVAKKLFGKKLAQA